MNQNQEPFDVPMDGNVGGGEEGFQFQQQQQQQMFHQDQYQHMQQNQQQFPFGFNEGPPMADFGFNGGQFQNNNNMAQFPYQQQGHQIPTRTIPEQQFFFLQHAAQENEELRQEVMKRETINARLCHVLKQERTKHEEDQRNLRQSYENVANHASLLMRENRALVSRVNELEGKFPLLEHPPIGGFTSAEQARRFIKARYNSSEPWKHVFDSSKYVYNPHAPAIRISPTDETEQPKIALLQLVDPLPTDRALFKLYSKSGLTWRRIEKKEQKLWEYIYSQLEALQVAQVRDGLIQVKQRGRSKQLEVFYENIVPQVQHTFDPNKLIKQEQVESPSEQENAQHFHY